MAHPRVRVAVKTLEAINAALKADQGARYRGFLGTVIMQAGDAFSTDNTPFRTHLGASLIGAKCLRELWYSFRWTTLEKFDGRMLRLFNRGHLEEPRFVALLLTIGCQVWQFDQNGKQFRISGHHGHFGGSTDAVLKGLPDLPPDVACLGEFKTHSDKSFKDLFADGVKVSKPKHYAQMNTYMGKLKLKHAAYFAVNKNTDEIYAEIVEYDPSSDKVTNERAEIAIFSKTAPSRISNNISNFECKFCSHINVCHGKDLPAVNCRTCVNVQVVNESWVCLLNDKKLTPTEQRAGCQQYSVNPEIKQPI